jgi:dTDP-glucose 4,6-dehydratase
MDPQVYTGGRTQTDSHVVPEVYQMRVMVTGGAGFIGRWVVKQLQAVRSHHQTPIKVYVLDNLSNGSIENIAEFEDEKESFKFIPGDIRDRKLLQSLFKEGFDLLIHLAASINVHESLQNPEESFENDVVGTFNLLEEARKTNTRFVYISTCMVYAQAEHKVISENHPLSPASPYAGSKLAGENLVESYHRGYGLPTVILRPFNTYGPFQKSNQEGGVVAIFIEKALRGEEIPVFGDGEQTRDFLYVDDCAEFIVRASFSEKATGQVINAGSGQDIRINDLARIICPDEKRIFHLPHHHPQSEIRKLLCDSTKARSLLNWEPKTPLRDGIAETIAWMKTR